jgi:uncharacterized protein (DUF1501 family)
MDPGFQQEGNMRRAIFVALSTGAVITSAAAISIGAAGSDSQSLSRAEYESAMHAIAASRERLSARCETLAGHEREVCVTEAAAHQMVRVAEIEANYRRNEASARALQRARIDARYQVDRARCAAHGGLKRDRCLIRAHATKGRALLDTAAPYEIRYRP